MTCHPERGFCSAKRSKTAVEGPLASRQLSPSRSSLNQLPHFQITLSFRTGVAGEEPAFPGHKQESGHHCAPPTNSPSLSPTRSARISVSPIKNASYPAALNRTISSADLIPLSATFTAPLGSSSAKRNAVPSSTLNVRKS